MTPYQRAVADVVTLLDNANINYTLDAGTLLKAYRGNDIFDDHDFDIAIFDPNIELVLDFVREVRDSGFRVRCQGNLPFFEDLLQIEIDLLNGSFSYIDIYLYFKFENEYIRRCIHKPLPASEVSNILYMFFSKMYRNSGKSSSFVGFLVWFIPYPIRRIFGRFALKIYRNFALTVWNVIPVKVIKSYKRKVINDIEFNILDNAEGYLHHRYGHGWRIPDPYWNFTNCEVYRVRSPSIVSTVENWIECDTFNIIVKNKRKIPLFSYSKRELSKIYDLDKKS